MLNVDNWKRAVFFQRKGTKLFPWICLFFFFGVKQNTWKRDLQTTKGIKFSTSITSKVSPNKTKMFFFGFEKNKNETTLNVNKKLPWTL